MAWGKETCGGLFFFSFRQVWLRLCKSFLKPVVVVSFTFVRFVPLISGPDSLAQGPPLTLPFLYIVCYKSNKRNVCSCFFLFFFFLPSKEKEGTAAKSFAGVFLFVFVFPLPPLFSPPSSPLPPPSVSHVTSVRYRNFVYSGSWSGWSRVSQCCMRQSRCVVGSTRSPHVHPAWKSLKSSSSSTTTSSTI